MKIINSWYLYNQKQKNICWKGWKSRTVMVDFALVRTVRHFRILFCAPNFSAPRANYKQKDNVPSEDNIVPKWVKLCSSLWLHQSKSVKIPLHISCIHPDVRGFCKYALFFYPCTGSKNRRIKATRFWWDWKERNPEKAGF